MIFLKNRRGMVVYLCFLVLIVCCFIFVFAFVLEQHKIKLLPKQRSVVISSGKDSYSLNSKREIFQNATTTDKNLKQNINEKQESTAEIVKLKIVAMFRNVCLVGTPSSKTEIVVYNPDLEENEVKVKLFIPPSRFLKNKHWNLRQVKNTFPSHYQVTRNITAYFLKLSKIGSIYHFWHDSFEGVYGAVKHYNQVKENKHVYYDGIDLETPCTDAIKCNVSIKKLVNSFNVLLDALNVSLYEDYNQIKNVVCYDQAVFGFKNLNSSESDELARVIEKSTGFSEMTCPKNQVVVHRRKYRRIVNTEELVQKLQKEGFKNVLAVDYEKLSSTEQLKLTICTKLMIGIHGGGLEWFRFMRHPAGVVEIGWKHWIPDIYADMAVKSGYSAAQIYNCPPNISDVTLEAYAHYNSVDFTNKNRTSLIDDLIKEGNTVVGKTRKNIWKWADCRVTVKELAEIAKSLFCLIENNQIGQIKVK